MCEGHTPLRRLRNWASAGSTSSRLMRTAATRPTKPLRPATRRSTTRKRPSANYCLQSSQISSRFARLSPTGALGRRPENAMFNSSVSVIASVERCAEIPLRAVFGQYANPPPASDGHPKASSHDAGKPWKFSKLTRLFDLEQTIERAHMTQCD